MFSLYNFPLHILVSLYALIYFTIHILENCTLLGYYTGTSGHKLEDRSSQLLHGGSLKSHITHILFCFTYTRSNKDISFLLCSSHVYIWIYLCLKQVFRTPRYSLLHNSCLSQHHFTCGSTDLVIHFPVPVFFVSVNTPISRLLHSSSLKNS